MLVVETISKVRRAHFVQSKPIKAISRELTLSRKVIRKSYATWQAERGIEETTLQVLLGHVRGSKVTRQVYVNPQLQARRKAVFEPPLEEQGGNDTPAPLATAGNKPQKAP